MIPGKYNRIVSADTVYPGLICKNDLPLLTFSGYSEKFDNQNNTFHRDSIITQAFIEERNVTSSFPENNLFSSEDIIPERMPDWYFMVLISVLIVMSWLRIRYTKFLLALFESSYNYMLATKEFKERNIVRKRFSQVLEMIYLINGSLFLLLVYRFYKWDLPVSDNFKIFCLSFGILLTLMLIRILFMRLTGYLFNRSALFSESLYHFYIYNKLLGIALIPFLIVIPYTNGILHEILFIAALSVVGIVYVMRIIRLVVFTVKNDILLFYLIVYLCTLEIIPVVVFVKVILSLR